MNRDLFVKPFDSGMSFPSKPIVSQGLHSHNNDANDDVSARNTSHYQNSHLKQTKQVCDQIFNIINQ